MVESFKVGVCPLHCTGAWFKHAKIDWLDEETNDLYFTAKAAIQTVYLLDNNRPERQHY
jgi:hypothetical protein